MRRRIFLGAVSALLTIFLLPPAGAARQGRGTPLDRDGDKIFDDLERRIDGRSTGSRVEVIALFSEGSSAGEVAQAKKDIGAFRVIREYDVLSGVAAEMTVGQLRALAARPDTLQIQHNSHIDFSLDTARAAIGVEKAAADFGEDGNNENSPICPEVRQYCMDDGVVAVLDSGINYYHPDLDGGKVLGGANCTTGECSSTFSYLDGSGHGTASASIIAGEGDGDSTVKGVAPGAALVGVKIGSTGTSVAILDAALEWTIANRETYGIDAINMSLNATVPSDGTESSARLTNQAAASGILPVSAAGNAGSDYGTVSFPSSAKYSVSVGAMAEPYDDDAGGWDPGFYLAPLSGRGPTADGRVKPDLVAPGVDITHAYVGDGYWTSSGTSLATPFVAGTALLALDADPTLGTAGTPCDPVDTSPECADGVIDSTMDSSLKNVLTSTAVDWGVPGPDNDYGHGRLDAYAAIEAASPATGSGGPDLPAHTRLQGTLASGGSSSHQISVTKTDAPIAATLLWDRAAGASSPNFNLTLSDPSGARVASAGSSNNGRHEYLSFRPTVTGQYTITASSAEGSGGYVLDVSFPGSTEPPPPPPPPSVPDAPSGLTATARSSTQIDLAWTDVAGETSYRIEKSSDGLGAWTQVGTAVENATAYVDSGLTPGTTYYYRVVAANSVGDSSPSNVASARTAAPPNSPGGVAATARSSSQIDVSWTDVASESGYKIQRSANGIDGWAQVGTTAANVTTFANTGLSAATSYHYRIVAYNAAGDSPASAVVTARTLGDTAAPTTPTNLKATNGKLKVSLTWTASTDSGGSGLAGYKIFRSTTSTGTFTQIGTSTTASFVDTAVAKGKTYWYYVQAYDKAGNHSAASAKVSGKPI
jgi:serine protease AprX